MIHRGRILRVVPKSYLPTYREVYERRQVALGADARDSTIPVGTGALVRAEPAIRRHARVRLPSRTWTLCRPPVWSSEGPLISETVAR